jgi:DNA polymerase-3 subunit epsilon
MVKPPTTDLKGGIVPPKLAFVDIETTGAHVTRDRIIEIGIVRVEEGKVVKKYQTLINPYTHLSPYISQMTGITADELDRAPGFREVAETIQELIEDCVFVAHNVRFDYGFLRNEFRRMEVPFSAKHFCTVRLSRQLFPQHKKHNLDSIIERFDIACENRHRALDDAAVLWEFVQRAQAVTDPEKFQTALANMLKRPSLPSGISPQLVAKLPESPGVYIFYGNSNYPLYVGKSKNIKERVLSHFTSDYMSSKEMNMCQQVERIETIETAGELGALLKESDLVKEMQPLYNRMLRKTREVVVVKKQTNPDGYETVSVATYPVLQADDLEQVLGIFRSRSQCQEHLHKLAGEFQLCHKLLGLEKARGACFGYQLNTCMGACDKKELALKYNLRFLQAFQRSKIRQWPFNGPIIIHESDDWNEKHETFVIDRWCLVNEDGTATPFDVDTYHILMRYIFDTKNSRMISVPKHPVVATAHMDID